MIIRQNNVTLVIFEDKLFPELQFIDKTGKVFRFESASDIENAIDAYYTMMKFFGGES